MDQQHQQKRKPAWILPLVALGIFAAGVYIGRVIAIQDRIFDEGGHVDIQEVIDLYSKTRSKDVSFDQFWDVWDRIHDQYVEEPDDVALFYGALEGLVEGLDDPYSVYLPPTDATAFAKDLAGEFEGIGAEIGIRDEQLSVVAPLPESPAEKAGLRAGDVILAIDGKETFGMSIEEAVINIRGEKGTPVILTITHNGLDTLREVEIIRDTINVPTVIWEMQDDDIGYLRVSHFNQETWNEFDKAVKELLLESPKGLVLDLRSNPGGFLETSIDVASEWVESGVIVSEGAPEGEKRMYRTRGRHRLATLPTVVLVDQGTASGSEIVAGALQDHDIAQIVGVQTFGKGSVQDFEILPDGSALKLTIARWFTPDDRAIDGEGIAPDVIVEEMFTFPAEGEEGEPVDNGLAKAREILLEN